MAVIPYFEIKKRFLKGLKKRKKMPVKRGKMEKIIGLHPLPPPLGGQAHTVNL